MSLLKRNVCANESVQASLPGASGSSATKRAPRERPAADNGRTPDQHGLISEVLSLE